MAQYRIYSLNVREFYSYLILLLQCLHHTIITIQIILLEDLESKILKFELVYLIVSIQIKRYYNLIYKFISFKFTIFKKVRNNIFITIHNSLFKCFI